MNWWLWSIISVLFWSLWLFNFYCLNWIPGKHSGSLDWCLLIMCFCRYCIYNSVLSCDGSIKYISPMPRFAEIDTFPPLHPVLGGQTARFAPAGRLWWFGIVITWPCNVMCVCFRWHGLSGGLWSALPEPLMCQQRRCPLTVFNVLYVEDVQHIR